MQSLNEQRKWKKAHRDRIKNLGYNSREVVLHKNRTNKLKEICSFLDIPTKYIIDYLIKSNFLTIENLELVRKTQKLEYTDVRE